MQISTPQRLTQTIKDTLRRKRLGRWWCRRRSIITTTDGAACCWRGDKEVTVCVGELATTKPRWEQPKHLNDPVEHAGSCVGCKQRGTKVELVDHGHSSMMSHAGGWFGFPTQGSTTAPSQARRGSMVWDGRGRGRTSARMQPTDHTSTAASNVPAPKSTWQRAVGSKGNTQQKHRYVEKGKEEHDYIMQHTSGARYARGCIS